MRLHLFTPPIYDSSRRAHCSLQITMYMRFLLIVALICTLTSYAYEVKRVRRLIPKPVSPTKDSFYVPKEGWEKTKPGTILASRKIQAGFTERRKINLDGAYQLLYRTSGVDDKSPSFTVTTVLVPKNARTNTVSYTHLTLPTILLV